MEEILIGPTEQAEIIHAVTEKHLLRNDGMCIAGGEFYDALLRAQVQKVWRVIRSGYYQLPDELVQALQAVGGEE